MSRLTSGVGRSGFAAVFALVLSCSSPADPPGTSGGTTPVVAPVAAERAAVALGVAALSLDDSGAPRMVRAITPRPALAGATADGAARSHLAALAPLWLRPGATDAIAETLAVHKLRGGAQVVALRQRINGVEIHGGDVRVLLAADGALTAVSGAVRPAVAKGRRFRLSAEGALVSALSGEYKVAVDAAGVARTAMDGDYVDLALPLRSDITVETSRAKRIYASTRSGLVPAWFIEMYASKDGSSDALRFLVAADDGRLLQRVDLSADDTFIYRAYADNTGERRPFDGPHQSWAPHPSGSPDGSYPDPLGSRLVAVEGLNQFNDPWLPDGATVTLGNNVDAYIDRDGDNTPAPPDFRADVTTPGAFGWGYNLTREPGANDTQKKAAIVNLFYTINWLHDWWYDSGFTEAAGNAQVDNYGRGGLGDDPIHAQAQDAADLGSRNNANMATPADGLPPRMQMFQWSGINIRSVTVTPAGGAARVLAANTAAFGPRNFAFSDDVVLLTDGAGPSPTDGCEPPTNNLAGVIALIDRGTCAFTLKVQNAQDAGAVGVIIANNLPELPPPALGGVSATITIGTLSITQEDGVVLRADLAAGAVAGALARESGVEIDGDLDTTVIAHEWGHYFHHRLAECSSSTQCRAMSEGWGDFLSLHTVLRPGDDPLGSYAVGVHDTRGIVADAGYFGIRRGPYSADRTINDLSFRHISDGEPLPDTTPMNPNALPNSQVHNTGEIWASMLLEAYVSLLGAHPYDEARRRMSDYMVAGLLLHPPEATFTEARDAILTAAGAIDPADVELMATAFASRGAGTCAIAPARESVDLVGVVEASELSGRLAIGSPSLTDDGSSCDADGYLDPGEVGIVRIPVANAGPVVLTSVEVSATTTSAGVTLGGPVQIASIPAFTQVEVELPVAIGLAATVDSELDLELAIDGAGGCTAEPVVATLSQRLGVDDALAVSTSDDVEARVTPWLVDGDGGESSWTRIEDASDGHAWLGADLGVISDTQLVSPPLVVSAAGDFVVSVSHRYRFEADPTTFYDGGVIEVTSDGGATWRDVTELGLNPGYDGVLGSDFDNPLGGREGFSADSGAFPDRETLSLDFGTQLIGQTVQIRFRIGTDAGVGAYGWEIDDIAATGIDNTPFPAVVAEGPTCQLAPVVDAGADQVVALGADVQLQGLATDGNDDVMTVSWVQEPEATVTLAGAETLTPSFQAPGEEATLVFRLDVSDPFQSSSDTVTIQVQAGGGGDDAGPTEPDAGDGDGDGDGSGDGGDGDDDDGCGCRTTTPASSGGMAMLMGLALFGLGRRRRSRSK